MLLLCHFSRALAANRVAGQEDETAEGSYATENDAIDVTQMLDLHARLGHTGCAARRLPARASCRRLSRAAASGGCRSVRNRRGAIMRQRHIGEAGAERYVVGVHAVT